MSNQPKISCVHSRLDKTSEMLEHPLNPKRYTSAQTERFAGVIRANGWRRAIVISDLSGFIIKGHGRLQAAKLLGLEFCPVEIQHYESTAAEVADMLADNRMAELSEINSSEVADLITEVTATGMKMESVGFTDADFAALMGDVKGETTEAPDPSPPEKSSGFSEKCVVGMFSFKLTRDEAVNWVSKVNELCERDKDKTIEEIKRRLKL